MVASDSVTLLHLVAYVQAAKSRRPSQLRALSSSSRVEQLLAYRSTAETSGESRPPCMLQPYPLSLAITALAKLGRLSNFTAVRRPTRL